MVPRRTLALALSLRAVAASAQPAPPRPPVRWEASACQELDLARVRRALAVELQDLLRPDGDPRPDALRITLSCARDAVTLRADSDPPEERSLAWSALPVAPRARARTVALVAVEMAFAAWVRPTPRPAPIAPSDGPSPAAPPPPRYAPRPSTDPERPRWTLAPTAGLRVLPRGAILGGGGLQLRHERPSGLTLTLDAQGLTDGRAITQWDGGLALGVVTAWQSWRFHLGAGLRGGVAVVDARPVGWVSPFLRVGGSLRLAGPLALDLAGVMGVGVTLGSGSPVEALEGVWCGLQAGLAWGP